MEVRKPRFAGTWYPGTRSECLRTIKRYENALSSVTPPNSALSFLGFCGGIVPHAGWYFSGNTAFSVYQCIDKIAHSSRNRPDLFFLFGMHLPPNGPNYLFFDEGFETPLGTIKVNINAAEKLNESFDFVREDALNAVSDNTIELQLPFIRHFFPEAEIVTAGVSPDDRALDIGEKAFMIAEELGAKPCFIGSTDLTHYGPNYGFIPKGVGIESVRWVKEENDRRIVEAFVNTDPREVLKVASTSHNACCSGAAAAAIAAVRKGGVKKGHLVQYTTSYDINPNSSFVGYAGIIF